MDSKGLLAVGPGTACILWTKWESCWALRYIARFWRMMAKILLIPLCCTSRSEQPAEFSPPKTLNEKQNENNHRKKGNYKCEMEELQKDFSDHILLMWGLNWSSYLAEGSVQPHSNSMKEKSKAKRILCRYLVLVQ